MKKVLIMLLAVLCIFAAVSCQAELPVTEPEVVEFTVGVGTYTHNPASPQPIGFTSKIEAVKGQYTVTAALRESLSTATNLQIGDTATCFAIVPTFKGDASNDASYSWSVKKDGQSFDVGNSFETAEKIIAQGNSWYGIRSILSGADDGIKDAGTYVFKFQVEKKSGPAETYYFEVIVK